MSPGPTLPTSTPQHHRALAVSAGWTLLLLFLGSVVHATGSSLACPDWPTCYGTMVPTMVGGIFWEHLHRLVAGGLILMWLLTGWLMRAESAPARIRRRWGWGLGLLLVQAAFGGITVLLKLPPAVSTTHLTLAFLFLGLTVTLAVETSPHRADAGAMMTAPLRKTLRTWATAAAALVLAQSILGALVRHLGAGMACPDVPLCYGRLVPPLDQPMVAVHFTHRVIALLTASVVIGVALAILRRDPRGRIRRLTLGAIALVLVQIGLGVATVAGHLAVVPDSLHTLGAASLFGTMVALATWGRVSSPHAAPERAPVAAAAR